MKQLEVVCGILHKADQVFIARRGEGQAAGIWEFPGGKVESGETHSEAIERELAEELGIHAEAERFLCDVMDEPGRLPDPCQRLSVPQRSGRHAAERPQRRQMGALWRSVPLWLSAR